MFNYNVLSAFQRAKDESHTLPHKPSPKIGWLRNANSLFYEQTDILSMKICYKVSLCQKFHIKHIGWPKNPILCMILRITLDVNR